MERVTCRRCQGLMHPIDPIDPLDVIQGAHPDDMRAWRCMTCGELIDPVIMQNRRRSRHHRSHRRGSTPRQPVFQDPDVE